MTTPVARMTKAQLRARVEALTTTLDATRARRDWLEKQWVAEAGKVKALKVLLNRNAQDATVERVALQVRNASLSCEVEALRPPPPF